MATKFSDFTAQAATGTTFVVGYDGTTNTRYTQDQLTNFVLDGTLSDNRTLKLNGNNLTIDYGTGNVYPSVGGNKFIFYPNGSASGTAPMVASLRGKISFPYLGHQGQGLTWSSYNTSLTAYGFTLYGGGGFSHNSGYSVIGPNMSYNSGAALTARLGIVGKHNDNTSYALRVQNSDNDELMQVRNDGTIAIGKGATLPVGVTSTVIGTGASANGNGTGIGNYATASGGGSTVLGSYSSAAGSYSIAIGYDADVSAVSSSIGIGANANVGAANSINIDASGNTASSNNDPGTLKVHLTSNTTPSFQVDAANGMTPPTFSSDPSSPNAGNVIYNTSDNKLKFYNGSAWADAAAGDSIYTSNGSINEDRVITVGHDPTTRVTYNTSFESSKSNNTTTRNSAGNILQIKETYTGQIPVGYSQTRGAVLKLQANTSSGTDTTSYINSFIINSGSSDYSSRDQMGFRTNKAFVFKATDTSWPLYFSVTGGPSNNAKSIVYSGQVSGGLFQLKAGNARVTKFTLADTSSTPGTNGYYRYIEAGNSGSTGNLILGRRLNGQSEEAYITCSGIGNASGDIAVGINQGTPTSTLHVTGSGSTDATTSLLVENSSGDDILNLKDNRQVQIGTLTSDTETLIVNGSTRFKNQVTVDTSTSATAFRIQQGGAYTVTMGRTAGSTGFLNVNSNNFTRFTVVAGSGVAINPTGTASNDASAALTITSTTKGMLPPRMNNTQRDAISSPATGLTLYSTTDSKLQFYNGSAWTDAGGGGDSIYTADGTLSGARTVTIPASGSLTYSSSGALSLNVTSSAGTTLLNGNMVRVPSTGRFEIHSFDTVLKRNYLKLYGSNGAYITSTANGFATVWNPGVTDPGASESINARLGVIGKSTTSTSDYAFRVQQSDNTDMLTVRDDGAITIGKSATTNGATSVSIGTSAKSPSSNSVSIGNGADARGSSGHVIIGSGAKSALNSSFSVTIGNYAETTATNGTAIGYGTEAAANSLALGRSSEATASKCINLNATGGQCTNSTANSFGVYISDASTPDFRILHDGNSYITGTGNFGVGVTTPSDRIQTKTSIGVIGDGTNAGKLKLYCEAGTAHHVAIEGPAHSGGSTYTIKLPNTAPSAGDILQSDSSGNLSWKSLSELDFSGLPTSDPEIAGRLYNHEGTIKVSIA